MIPRMNIVGEHRVSRELECNAGAGTGTVAAAAGALALVRLLPPLGRCPSIAFIAVFQVDPCL